MDDDLDPCVVLDERVAAYSALAASARYAAAASPVPQDAERDALLAVAQWADRAVHRALVSQEALLRARRERPA
jgi:hypothetical protein